MFGKLFFNIATSMLAFFVTSVIGLVLVPLLVHAYGLAGYGVATLARLFLPTAAFGLFDFGFGELATQAVASARADGDWACCGRRLRLGLIWAATIGAFSGAVMIGLAWWLPGWMKVDDSSQAGLSLVLAVTGALSPLLFASLVFEGSIKGFENYVAQRRLEVLSTMAYAASAVACVHAGLGVLWVCAAQLAALALRALLAFATAKRALRTHQVRLLRWTPDDRAWYRRRVNVMAANKALGACQTQLAPLLLGFLLGPASVGAFDVLSRLPRVAKSILGLLSSTLLPVASRLETASDAQGMRRLSHTGMLLVGLAALPLLAAAMVFSEPTLRLWLGPTLSGRWVWQSLMYLVPAFTVLVGFGATALMVRPHAIAAMNRLIALQLVIQFAVAFTALSSLQERAFILGQVCAVGITFFLQLRLIDAELGSGSATYRRLLRLLGIMIVLAVPSLYGAPAISSIAQLVAAGLGYVIATWLLSVFVVLSAAHRQQLRSALLSTQGRARQRLRRIRP